jgi:GT2 family glycosyltransferase
VACEIRAQAPRKHTGRQGAGQLDPPLSYHGRVSPTPPEVTVIVRTKDRLNLLPEALASIAAQSGVSAEVVVVNDGGSAVEGAVAAVRGHLPIKVVELRPGRGRCAAANAGLGAARGTWVGFLDDDDLLAPDALRALIASAGGDRAIPYGKIAAHRIDAQGTRSLRRTFDRPFDLTALLFENFIPIHACLVPAAELRAVGGMDEGLEVFEDWDLFLRLSDRLPFRFVARDVGEYRLFDDAFIVGRGGSQLQARGRLAVIRKHHWRFTADRLAGIRRFVTEDLVPGLSDEEAADVRGKLLHLEGAVRLLDKAAAVERAPLVSVVIPNYNGRHHLERCLPALAATADVPTETIVVDNGSTDGSVRWLAESWPGLRVLDLGRNLGFGEANRRGVAAARGRYVAFLNSDTVVEPSWLEELLIPMEADDEIAASCATLRLAGLPGVLNARGGGMTSLGYGFDIDYMVPEERPPVAARSGPRWHDVLFPTCAAAVMRAEEFVSCGGFDPAFFMYHEDVDLGWRLWLLGRRVVVCDDAVVAHAFGGTSRSEKGLRWKEVLGMRHNLRSLLKHDEAASLVRVARGIAGVWWRARAFRQAAAVLSWNATRLPGTLAARWRLQRRRTRRDRELLDRGLVSGARYPAPSPVPPETTDAASWLLSPTLLPGWPSGATRLGAGWFAAEKLAGERARWTCGHAEAYLRVAPRAAGTLTVSLQIGALRPGERVTVACNGAVVATTPTTGSWQSVAVPARADDEGLLHVTLRSPVWVPHYDRDDWDFRVLGCAVRRIRFHAGDPAPPPPCSVSVVIPTYNRWTILARTLAALEAQTHGDLQVIVVDDGSDDATWQGLRAWADAGGARVNAAILRQANAKQGQARNAGLQHATGDLVLFLGDDIVPEPEFVEAHVAKHRELGEPCAVIGLTDWDRGAMRVTPFLDFVNQEGAQFAFSLLADGGDAPYTCLYTSNVSLPRAALGDTPFDPAFTSYGWEDVELGYRLARRGLRIVYTSNAVARHCHPTTMGEFLRRQRQVGRAAGSLFALHPELEGDEFMPPCRPRFALRVGAPVLAGLRPLLRLADRASLRMPGRVYRAALLAAYFSGRRETARAGRR